jgi:hypothetical protein
VTAVAAPAELLAVLERAERERLSAAEAERAAFEAWQESYGAYEVARDDATGAYHAYMEAIGRQ